MKRIKLDRFLAMNKVERENWKDLIATLVLCGYEVYGDENEIVFKLGDCDEVREDGK